MECSTKFKCGRCCPLLVYVMTDAVVTQSTGFQRSPFSADIRLANREQQLAFITKFYGPCGSNFNAEEYIERYQHLLRVSPYIRKRMLNW